MNPSVDKEKIRQFIQTQCLKGKLVGPLTDTTPLRSSGLLDSLALMSLISFLEKEFHFEFTTQELTTGSFDSIHEIARLVDGKRT